MKRFQGGSVRRALLPLAILALFALGGSSALARHVGASPQTFAFAPFGGGAQKSDPVEQETDWPWLPGPIDCSQNEHCVVNPTPCVWDVDDHWRWLGQGTIDKQTTVTQTFCFVLDSTQHYVTNNGVYGPWSGPRNQVGIDLLASSPNLVVSITYVTPQRAFTAPAVWDQSQHAYRYNVCTTPAYGIDDPAVNVVVPGSGGVGLRTDVTITVSNPTNKAIRDLSGTTGPTGVGANIDGCVWWPTNVQSVYPFTWYTGQH